jgi:hypothetical protein
MAQRCGVCAHPRRAEVDEILQGRHNASKVARELGVTRFSVQRHREKHLTPEGWNPEKSQIDPLQSGNPEGADSEFKKNRIAGLHTSRANPEIRKPKEPLERGTQITPRNPAIRKPTEPLKRNTRVDPQTAFLTSYAANGDVQAALKAGGVSRTQLRKWQETDEAFSLRFHNAEIEAIELLEAEARTRAVAGSQLTRRVYRHGLLYEEIHEWRPSDAMLTKLLQAHKPEKYGDKLTVTQTTVVKAIDADAWNSV